jgi:hydroxymethylpyrimidine/phosphomethylpyrimidine kinase
MRTALTIAGSDPSGGAGVQADLKTFAAHGVYGVSAITAITVQNTLGVEAIAPLSADLVGAQIESIAGDFDIHAVKIGMLAGAAIVEAVAAAITSLDLPLVVLDPVLVSSSGERLLDDDGLTAMVTELLPRARVVTPNLPEAEVLSGIQISSSDDAREAARRIQAMGPRAVIITGGHAPGGSVVDLLLDDDAFHAFHTDRVASQNTHGTGCTYASAIAAAFALGHSLLTAAPAAQRYVAGAIANGPAVGRGRGPLNHFWQRQAG